MTGTTEVPQYHEMLWPALQAVYELGGSASIGEMVETVVKREGYTDKQQAVLDNDGPETEIESAGLGSYLSQGHGAADQQCTWCVVAHRRGCGAVDGPGRE